MKIAQITETKEKKEKPPERRRRRKDSLEYPAKKHHGHDAFTAKHKRPATPEATGLEKENQKMPKNQVRYIWKWKEKGFLSSKRKERKERSATIAQPLAKNQETRTPEKSAPASMPVGWVYVETKRSVNIPLRPACDVSASRGRNVVTNNRNAQNVSRTTLSSCS